LEILGEFSMPKKAILSSTLHQDTCIAKDTPLGSDLTI